MNHPVLGLFCRTNLFPRAFKRGPGANVTLVNTDTRATRTVDTGADGVYIISNLVPGSYQLRVTKEGFTSHVQSGIVLEVAEIDSSL
jgi:hypothetical protein